MPNHLNRKEYVLRILLIVPFFLEHVALYLVAVTDEWTAELGAFHTIFINVIYIYVWPVFGTLRVQSVVLPCAK